MSFLEFGTVGLGCYLGEPESTKVKHNSAIQLIPFLFLTNFSPFFSPDSQPFKRPKPSAGEEERRSPFVTFPNQVQIQTWEQRSFKLEGVVKAGLPEGMTQDLNEEHGSINLPLSIWIITLRFTLEMFVFLSLLANSSSFNHLTRLCLQFCSRLWPRLCYSCA